MNSLPDPLTWDVTHQLVLVAVAIEAFATMGLVPRVVPSEPSALITVVVARTAALVALGVISRELPLRAVIRPLLIWSVLTLPPLVWSYALEAREGFPWAPVLAASVYALGAHAAARMAGRAWVLVPVVPLLACALPPLFNPVTGQLEPVVPVWLLLSVGLVLVSLRRRPREVNP